MLSHMDHGRMLELEGTPLWGEYHRKMRHAFQRGRRMEREYLKIKLEIAADERERQGDPYHAQALRVFIGELGQWR